MPKWANLRLVPLPVKAMWQKCEPANWKWKKKHCPHYHISNNWIPPNDANFYHMNQFRLCWFSGLKIEISWVRFPWKRTGCSHYTKNIIERIKNLNLSFATSAVSHHSMAKIEIEKELHNFTVFLWEYYFTNGRKGQDDCFALIYPFRSSSIKLVTSGQTK